MKSGKVKKSIPFGFVLEALAPANPYTKPMFGCLAVYVGEKIVVILRDRESSPRDRGVWLATIPMHHASLRQNFPNLRDIELFGPGPTGWQVLSCDAFDFEESVLRVCEFILRGDERIGKVPKSKKPKGLRRSPKKERGTASRKRKPPKRK